MMRKYNWKVYFTHNSSYKIIALMITLLLWLLVIGREHKVESKEFPVEITPPKGYIVTKVEPETITVKVKGHPKLMNRFFLRQRSIDFSVDKFRKTHLRLRVTEDKINLAFGVKLVSLSPRMVFIELQKEGEEEKDE